MLVTQGAKYTRWTGSIETSCKQLWPGEVRRIPWVSQVQSHQLCAAMCLMRTKVLQLNLLRGGREATATGRRPRAAIFSPAQALLHRRSACCACHILDAESSYADYGLLHCWSGASLKFSTSVMACQYGTLQRASAPERSCLYHREVWRQETLMRHRSGSRWGFAAIACQP